MSNTPKRKKWLKALLVIASIGILLLVLAIGFVYKKQDELIQKAITQLNQGFSGQFNIQDSHISPFENFPYVSIDLENVEVLETKSDTATALVNIQDVYVGFDIISIITGAYEVKKIKLSNGFVKLIQHTDGTYNIANALSNDEVEEGSESPSNGTIYLSLDAFEMENIDLLKINEANNILAEVFIEEIESSLSTSKDHIKAQFDSKMLFNLILDGDTSFLHDKHLTLSTGIDYDLTNGLLAIDPSELLIEQAQFLMEGTIDMANDQTMDLKFSGQKPNFDLFLAFIPPELSPLVNRYENGGSVYFEADVTGPSNGTSPHIEIEFGCKEAFIENISEEKAVNDLYFKGHFTNGIANDLTTMAVTIEDFTARPETGTFKGNISVENFESPDIDMQVNADFNLDFLTAFFELDQLEDVTGKVALDMNFHDIIDLDDPSKAIERLNESYYTQLKIEGLNFTSPDFYLPIEDVNIQATVDGHKALINQFTAKTGNSDITITASISDLPAIMHHTALPLEVDMQVSSGLIDISQITQAQNDSTGFNEKIENLSLGIKFNSTAQAFTESPNLPLGEFFITELNAQLVNYPHLLHDFNADIIIDSTDFNIIDFTGMLDQSDFHFNGKLNNYDVWFDQEPKGNTTVNFDLTSSLLQLEDLFSYNGENYVPEDYRHEEIQNLKIHAISTLEFDQVLQSASLAIDKIDASLKEHLMRFENFSGTFFADSTKLVAEDFKGKLGNSEFTTNLTYYLKEAPLNSGNSFRFKSPKLDFDQLFSYIPPSESTVGDSIDHQEAFNLFELPFSNTEFSVNIDDLKYHRYLIKDFKLAGRMQEDHYIYVDTLDLNAAGGSMKMTGYFNGSDPENIYISPNMKVEDIDLEQLLFKFENFGQDQLVSENLKGKLTGSITGAIHIYPDLVPDINNSELAIDIEVLNGSLQNFAPFDAMSSFFTDKNLALVRFDTLKNTFTLENGDLIIPKMNINTSLGYFEISGRQGIDLDMNYDMRVPLKVIARAGVQKIFGRKNQDNSDQVDEIIYRDESRNTRFINVNIKGTPEDYDIALKKSKKE